MRTCGVHAVAVERNGGGGGDEFSKPFVAKGANVVDRPKSSRLSVMKDLMKTLPITRSIRAPADKAARNMLQWHGQPNVDRLGIDVQTRSIIS